MICSHCITPGMRVEWYIKPGTPDMDRGTIVRKAYEVSGDNEPYVVVRVDRWVHDRQVTSDEIGDFVVSCKDLFEESTWIGGSLL